MTATLIVEPDAALSKLARRKKTKMPTAESLAKQINNAHFAVEQAMQDAIDLAMKCGDLLIEAKSQCAHGRWMEWLKKNFEGSDRSARVYMRLSAHRDLIEAKWQSSADLTIEKALNYIAPKNIKEQAVSTASKLEDQQHESMASAVLEFDEMLQTADAFNRQPDEAYAALYGECAEPGETIPGIEERKREIEEWRSAPWFDTAVETVRSNRIKSAETENIRNLVAGVDDCRQKASALFLEWRQETTDSLANADSDQIEKLRREALWWDRQFSRTLAGAQQTKFQKFADAEISTAIRIMEGGAK